MFYTQLGQEEISPSGTSYLNRTGAWCSAAVSAPCHCTRVCCTVPLGLLAHCPTHTPQSHGAPGFMSCDPLSPDRPDQISVITGAALGYHP